MKGRTPIGRWLVALLPLMMALPLALPALVAAGGEVTVKCSKEVAQVGDTVTCEATLPEPGEVAWDFDDGATATGTLVQHQYERAGDFTIVTSVTYSTGAKTKVKTDIRVIATTGNRPPKADAQASPQQTLAGLPITFDASASTDPDGQISRYFWNFRDGVTSTLSVVQHSYSQPGTYLVILTVTDNGEMDASDKVTVTVSALPAEVTSGVGRAVPPPLAPAPKFDPLVLVDLGVWDMLIEATGRPRYLYSEYESPPIDPPFQGVAASSEEWLLAEPAEFSRTTGTAVLVRERISVPDTSVLPRAHTSWGMITLVFNGLVVEMPVAVTLRGPDRDISADVWPLYNDLLAYLTDKGQRSVMAYTPRFSNGADKALGLITEYIIEGGSTKMPREEFIVKVAELLTGVDENQDGTVGFTDMTELDLLLRTKAGK